jgi:hypothetical protein
MVTSTLGPSSNEENSDRSLFLEVGFTGPHEPWNPLPRHLEMYRDADIPLAHYRDGELDDNPPEHTSHRRWFEETTNEAQIRLRDATREQIAEMRRHYYGNITTVESVGIIKPFLGAWSSSGNH